MHDLRLVRGGLPGADRARRHASSRSAATWCSRRADSRRSSSARLPEHGDGGQPVGPAASRTRLDWAKGLDVAVLAQTDAPPSRAPDQPVTAGNGTAAAKKAPRTVPDPYATDPVLGRLRRRLRRAQPQGRAGHGRAPQAGRDPVLGAGHATRPARGDPARRAGNEYLFQMLAEENVATLTMAHDEHGVRTIVASLPALLQHDPQRVPAVRPDRHRGHPPHPAARHAGRRGPPEARVRGSHAGGRLPRRLLPGPLQRGLRARAGG